MKANNAVNHVAVAWSLAVGFELSVAVILGDPAYLNPGVVFGNVIMGALPILRIFVLN